MPAPTICTITGSVINLLGDAVENCTITVAAYSPFIHPDDDSWVAGQLSSVNTDSAGDFSIAVIETATPQVKVKFTFDYYDGVSGRKQKSYAVIVPDSASAVLTELITADTPAINTPTFAASNVTVSTITNLSATNVQAALAEHQADIDAINTTTSGLLSATLADGSIFVGNSSNVATGVAVTGDIAITNTGVTSIAAGVIVNADINASAAIAFSKLASLTAGSVLLGNASNVATATALTGDVTVNSSGVTAIGSGVIVNADVSASAAIARSKLASGTAYRVVANDSSGVMSENAALTAGNVVYADANGQLATDAAKLYWDATNNRLGIGNGAPTDFLHITGTATSYSIKMEGDSGTANRNYGIKVSGADGLLIERTNSSLTALQINSADGVGVRSSAPSGYAFASTAQISGDVPIMAKGSASGTGNLQEWQNSAGTALALIDYTGQIQSAALTASRAVATDASKNLVSSATTSTELGYVNGVTSAIQTQINTKAPSASPTFSGTITTPLTASRAVVTGASSELAASATTATEIGYVSGVTSAIQTQINTKTGLDSNSLLYMQVFS